MEIHKQFIEVAGYAQTWNAITYIPTEIIANDETCTVKMTLVDANQDFTDMVFEGKHNNFNFVMEVNDLQININLQTRVIRKIRRHDND